MPPTWDRRYRTCIASLNAEATDWNRRKKLQYLQNTTIIWRDLCLKTLALDEDGNFRFNEREPNVNDNGDNGGLGQAGIVPNNVAENRRQQREQDAENRRQQREQEAEDRRQRRQNAENRRQQREQEAENRRQQQDPTVNDDDNDDGQQQDPVVDNTGQQDHTFNSESSSQQDNNGEDVSQQDNSGEGGLQQDDNIEDGSQQDNNGQDGSQEDNNEENGGLQDDNGENGGEQDPMVGEQQDNSGEGGLQQDDNSEDGSQEGNNEENGGMQDDNGENGGDQDPVFGEQQDNNGENGRQISHSPSPQPNNQNALQLFNVNPIPRRVQQPRNVHKKRGEQLKKLITEKINEIRKEKDVLLGGHYLQMVRFCTLVTVIIKELPTRNFRIGFDELDVRVRKLMSGSYRIKEKRGSLKPTISESNLQTFFQMFDLNVTTIEESLYLYPAQDGRRSHFKGLYMLGRELANLQNELENLPRN